MRIISYFDEQMIKLIESIRTHLLNKFFIFISSFGAVETILFIAFALTILLLMKMKKINIVALWVALSGSVLSAYILKLAVHRPRPLDGIIKETSFSFPSAHAVLSLVFYGFMMYLFLRTGKNRSVKLFVSASLSILIILIGFSRLYLGVHFLSDVIIGYFLGGLWFVIGIKLSKLKNFK